MGGTLGPGNVTPKAEFNAYADPRALKLVLASGVRLRVVGLDATRTVAVGEAELARAGIESGRAREFWPPRCARCAAPSASSRRGEGACCTTRARSRPRSRRSSSRSRRARSK